MLDPQSHAHYRREIMTQLTILATSATETVIGTEYANQEERPRRISASLASAVYGTTVPDTFWDAMRRGTISRWLAAALSRASERGNYPDRQDPDPIENDLPDLAAAIAQVAAGDDTLLVMAPCVRPHLRMVELDTDAKKLDHALMQKELELLVRMKARPLPPSSDGFESISGAWR